MAEYPQLMTECQHLIPEYEYDSLTPQPGADGRSFVRLMKILPSLPFEIRVEIELERFALDDAPPFMALSYCWGDPEVRHPVRCGETFLTVTSNLYMAMRYIRDRYPMVCMMHGHQECACDETFRSRPSWLWADAVCINQASNAEKSHQVPLMRQIYSAAEETLIWLGHDVSRPTLEMIPILAAQTRKKYHDKGDSRIIFEMTPEDLYEYQLPPPRDNRYRELLSLLQRPWFQRVWIIQEVAVSRRPIILNNWMTVNWQDLVFATDFAMRIGAFQIWDDPEIVVRLFRIHLANRAIVDNQQISLLGLLLLYRKFQASNARDKVYALYQLSLDSGSEGLNIIPDYDIETAELYKRTAVSILNRSQKLDILSVSRPPRTSEIKNVPSWAPDWSISDNTVAWRGGRVTDQSMYTLPDFGATPTELLSEPEFSNEERELGLTGHVIDSIIQVGDINSNVSNESLNWLNCIHHVLSEHTVYNSWEQLSQCRSKTKYQHTGEDILDVYWQVLCLGQIYEGYNQTREQFSSWDQSNRSVGRHLPLSYLRPIHKLLSLPMFIAMSVLMLFRGVERTKTGEFRGKLTYLEDRRMFKTQEGYIGIGPAAARSGDQVGLFRGGAFPLVIRKEEAICRWSLVGDCYLHGVMSGEAFRSDDCDRFWFV